MGRGRRRASTVAAQLNRRAVIRGMERRSKMGQGATGKMAEVVAPFIGPRRERSGWNGGGHQR
jgi:hypothetical protein